MSSNCVWKHHQGQLRGPMLVPPENFGLVEEGIYRCARVDPLNFAFFETLDLKSLILLDAEKPPRVLLNFFEDKPTAVCYIGRAGLKIIDNQDELDPGSGNHEGGVHETMEDWMIVRPNLIVEIFEIVFNRHKHNVMIVDKTESIIGLLRKIQKWSFSSIVNEYRLYAGNRATYPVETFLELMKLELVSYEANEAREERTRKEGVKIVAARRSFSSRSGSLSKGAEDFGLGSAEFEELERANADDLSLSASPQIPHELLQLAKARKAKKNASKDDRSAEEVDHTSNNTYMYYRDYGTQFDNLTQRDKKRGIVKIVLPQEHRLPLWFVRQRDDWEALYRSRNSAQTA